MVPGIRCGALFHNAGRRGDTSRCGAWAGWFIAARLSFAATGGASEGEGVGRVEKCAPY